MPYQNPDYRSAGSPVVVGSPQVGPAPLDQNAQPVTPFRVATLERSELIGVDTLAMTAAEQVLERTIPGTGFVFGFDLDVNCVTAGNALATAFNEDGPYAALSSVIFRDVTGELVNADGFSLELLARYGNWKRFAEGSADVTVWNKVTGSGATGGSFRFHLPVPIALNRRTLLGLVANQDRAQSYAMRHNLAGSGTVYSTAPTTLGTVTINRTYESYAVPAPTNDMGGRNQVIPPFYGVIPYLTKSISSNAPVGGQATNHYLQRLGTTIRLVILVIRQNGSRTTAEGNLPTNILFKVGNQTIFNETAAYRRHLMFARYGFDAPAGVFVYDTEHDFAGLNAGGGLGNDWYWTQQVTNGQFVITYPAALGSTGNTLTVLTSDMTVPDGMSLYAG